MKWALMVSVAVVLGLVTGFGMFALLRWPEHTIRTRTQPTVTLIVAGAVLVTFYAPGRTWWLVTTFGAVSLIAICAVLGVRRRPDVVPVARQLLARSPTA